MNKEYYTKAEVDAMLLKQKKEILSFLSLSTHSQNKGFEINTQGIGRIMKRNFLNLLRLELTKSELIDETDHQLFFDAFTGKNFNELDSPKIQWKGQKNLCPYLIDVLIDYEFLNIDKKNLKITKIFGIKNPAQLRKYEKSIDEHPFGYELIDNILFRIKKFMIEIDEDHEYLADEILPNLPEEDNLDFPEEHYSDSK
jgi:hypothetical protein